MRIRFLASSLIAVCTGCMTLMGIKQVPLAHSSLDMNNGTPHMKTIQLVDLDQLTKTISSLGEKRDLVIVKKECPNESECDLVYKRRTDSRSKTTGSGVTSSGVGSSSTTTYNIEFSSTIFATLRKQDSAVKIEMVGVPVVNGKPSCPPLLETRGECKAELFNVQGDQTPAESFRGIWGVDISGQAEAEIIAGMLAELD